MAAPAHEAMTPEEELLKASETGNLEAVERLLAAGANKEAMNPHGETPLFVAAANGNTPIVERLLAAGANKDAMNGNKATPLFIAVLNGHTPIVERLLAAGANKDAANENEATPLFVAAANGNTPIVERLLAAGANKEAANVNRATPLFIAAANGHTAIVERLLAKRANTEAANKNKTTPLLIALAKGHLEIVRRLIGARANIEAQMITNKGNTPLMIAAKDNHKDIVELLLKLHANRNRENYEGYTAKQLAAIQGHIDIVKLFSSVKQGSYEVDDIIHDGKATVVEVTPRKLNIHGNSITATFYYLDKYPNINIEQLFQFVFPELFPGKERIGELPGSNPYKGNDELLGLLRSLNAPEADFGERNKIIKAIKAMNDSIINELIDRYQQVVIFSKQGIKVKNNDTGAFNYYIAHYTNDIAPEDELKPMVVSKYSLEQAMVIKGWVDDNVLPLYLARPDIFMSVFTHPLVGNERLWRDVQELFNRDYNILFDAASPTTSERILYRRSDYWPVETVRRRTIFATSSNPVPDFVGQAKVIIPSGTRILDISTDLNPKELEVLVFPSVSGANMVIEPQARVQGRPSYVIRNVRNGNEHLPRSRRRTRRNNQNRRSTRRRRS